MSSPYPAIYITEATVLSSPAPVMIPMSSPYPAMYTRDYDNVENIPSHITVTDDYSIKKEKESKMQFDKFVIGDKVKIVGVTSGHGQAIGSIFTLSTQLNGYWRMVEVPNLNFSPVDLVLVSLTKEKIAERVASLEKEVKCWQLKLEWMEETANETFNEDEFKVFGTLKTLDDSKLSRVDKARLIAGLIRS